VRPASASDGDLRTVSRTRVHVVLHVTITVAVNGTRISAADCLWITHEPAGADRRRPGFTRIGHPHLHARFAARIAHVVKVLRFRKNFRGWRGLEAAAQREIHPV